MGKLFYRSLIVCCILFTMGKLSAQQLDTQFWFVVPDASNEHGPGCDRPVFFMFTADNEDAEVTMSMPANSAFKPRTIKLKKYTSQRLVFSGLSVDTLENKITDANKITNKGILITSTKPIAVYYQLDGTCSKDIFALKGSMALGNKFYTPFQTQFPRHNYNDVFRQINIVAAQDGTTVTIIPKGNIVGTNAGGTKTITLNRGQAFLARESVKSVTGAETGQQYSGSYISSNAPVAVVVSDDPVESHSNTGHDMIGDQIVPVDQLGNEYVTVRGYTSEPQYSGYATNDYVYIVATENSTTVAVNSPTNIVKTLNAGETYQYKLTDNAVYFKTSKPAYCFHQSGVGGEMGGAIIPSMYSIAARRLAFYKQTFDKNALFLIFRKGTASGFRLNDKVMGVTETAIPGVSDWVYTRYEINNSTVADGPCVIDNSLGAFALGYFTYTSGTTALYGFLSNFGSTTVWPDTTYRCAGKDIVLDAGYGSKYEWSTGATTPTITVSTPGQYWAKVTVNNMVIELKTFVVDDWFQANIHTPDTAYVNLNHPVHLSIKRSAGKAFNWSFEGGTPSTSTDSALIVKWSTIGKKKIDLKVSSDLIGKDGGKCDTVLTTKTIVVVGSQEHPECDDYYGAYHSGSNWTFDILQNDLVYCNSNLLAMTKLVASSLASTAGSALSISSNKLVYVPKAGFYGIDTIKYESEAESAECSKRISASVYVYVYPNKFRGCPTGLAYPIGIKDTKNDLTVDWSGSGVIGNALGSSTLSGTYGLDAIVVFKKTIAAFNNKIPTQFIVDIIPATMTWNGKMDNNWNNPLNWNENTVPYTCTNVHIPGNAPNYPNLWPNYTKREVYGDPVCNNITFHFGGEVARQEFLTYNKAYIQYNFGYYDGSNKYMKDGDALSATPMARGRWYALAAPLKKIASGDYSVGGFPNMWQRGFMSSEGHNGETLSGEWYIPDNNNAREVGANQNYAISIWAGEYLSNEIGEDDHTNLNALKGVLEMPYFENSTANAHHRIHSYDGTKSSFRYYWAQQKDLPLANVLDHPPGTITRGQESYRFVFEDNMNKPPLNEFAVTVPAGTDIMIGNPFLSSLSFGDFYKRNLGNIEEYFRLFTGSGFTTYTPAMGYPLDIASYQGFFLKTKGTGTITLYFPYTSSVTRTSGLAHQLKAPSAGSKDNILKLGVRNSHSNNVVTLALNSGRIDRNVPQMFIQKSEVADDAKNYLQLYVKGRDGLKSSVIYESGSELEIPVGIVGTTEEISELYIENVNSLNATSLVLYDELTGRSQDLIKNPVFKFSNVPSHTSDRFILKVNGLGAPTDIAYIPNEKDVNIYAANDVLYIKSENEIMNISISTIHGIRIFEGKVGYSGTFSHELPSSDGVYLVTVTLSNGKVQTEKVVMK